MKNQKKNDLHITEPVILHILSYMKDYHNSLCKLISKSLSAYAAYGIKEKEKRLPVSLILSSDVLMEIFKFILMRKMIRNESWVNSSIILVAVRKNNLLALFWLETHILRADNHADMKQIIWNGEIMSFAARNGNLEMLEWLQKHHCPLDLKTFSKAAKGCHVQVLYWLQESYGWDASDRTCEAIVSTGRSDILQWALQSGCPWDARCAYTSARHGHADMFRWIWFNRESSPIDMDSLCSGAAFGGHLELLQLAREYHCPWDERTCKCAVRTGKLEILQWVRENRCPWDARTCSAAARYGHLHILQWARKNGCPWNEFITCEAAAKYGHLHILQWGREQGCPWDARTCEAAAEAGSFEILQWAREQGCPWNARTCEAAARYGHLHILQWARKNGCPWNEFITCEAAAKYGHLHILQWGREQGCPWDARTCEAAAEAGFFEILQWAQNNGCPWNENEDAGEDGNDDEDGNEDD